MMASISISSPVASDGLSSLGAVSSWERRARIIQREQLSAVERIWVEDLAYRWGAAPESYDVACSTGELLKTPCASGLANLYSDGRFWHIPGGLICPPGLLPSMIDWLKSNADSQRKTLAVYSIGEQSVDDFLKAGFAVNKFGEEPILDLESLDWKGKAFEWVRRQTHACERAGLEVVEISDPTTQIGLASELRSIHDDDLSDRVYSQPLRLLEGEFDCHSMHRRRLFVARHIASQQIEGFVAASPMLEGEAWALETYRKRRSAPRGVVPFLFRKVIDQLRQEGVEHVSLCLVPGRGVADDNALGSDRRLQFILKLWYGHLNFLFNTAGQDFFKSRFRPRYEARHICVYPCNSVSSLLSFLKVSRALNINWRNLARSLFNRKKSA